MIKAVMDTNVLVSALLSPSGAPAKVFDHVLNGNVTLCFDSNMMHEYKEVLSRPKFNFNPGAVAHVLDFIFISGISVVPEPLNVDMIDEDDRIFYETAVHVNGYLVTGKEKHFPDEPFVVSPNEFLLKMA